MQEHEWIEIIQATQEALGSGSELPYFELPLPTELEQLSKRCPREVQTRFHVAWPQLPATLLANRISPALEQGVPVDRLAVLCPHFVDACCLDYTEKLEDVLCGNDAPRRSNRQFAARLWGVSETEVTSFDFESKRLRRFFRASLPLSAVCLAIRSGVPQLTQDQPKLQLMAEEVATFSDDQILHGPWIQLCSMLRHRFLQLLDVETRWDLWMRRVIPAASAYNEGTRLVFHPDLIDLCGPP